MALTDTKCIYSFGSAEHGKLGIGNIPPTALVNIPTKIPTMNYAKAISCGFDFSLALCEDKSLYLWGHGWEGQLGFGSKESSNVPRALLSTIR